MRHLALTVATCFVVFGYSSLGLAQTDQGAAKDAEIKMLRTHVDRLVKQVADLKAEVAKLRALNEDLLQLKEENEILRARVARLQQTNETSKEKTEAPKETSPTKGLETESPKDKVVTKSEETVAVVAGYKAGDACSIIGRIRRIDIDDLTVVVEVGDILESGDKRNTFLVVLKVKERVAVAAKRGDPVAVEGTVRRVSEKARFVYLEDGASLTL